MSPLSIVLLFWYLHHVAKSDGFDIETDIVVNPTIPSDSPVDDTATDFLTLLTNSHVFADKSLFINDMLKSPHKAILITSPPKWGKTINLHMLETFLEIEVDQKGRKVTPKTETFHYKLLRLGELKDGGKLVKPLLISKYNDLFGKYQGRYPVLYIDFSFRDIPVTTLGQLQEAMRQKVSTMFERYRYMLCVLSAIVNGTSATDEEKFVAGEEYDKFLMYLECRSPLDDTAGLDFLGNMLQRHYKRKIFLLIDEYDHLVNHLLLESTSRETDEIMEYYLDFLTQSIRDSEYVAKSIVTGTMTAAKNVSKFGLNNLVDYNFIDDAFSHYLGYTAAELRLVADHLNITADDRDAIDSWLNGFNVNSTVPDKLINPRSLNYHLRTKLFAHPDNITAEQPILNELLKIPEFEEAWCALLSGSNFTISVISPKFTSKDLKGLRHMVANAKYYEDYYLRPDAVSTDIALHYLLVNGYLTLSEYQYIPSHHSNLSLTLVVPNREHYSKFRAHLDDYYTLRRIGLGYPTLDKYTRDIASAFRDFLRQDKDAVQRIQQVLHQFFVAIPPTIQIESENDTLHVHFNKNLIRSSLLYVFSRSELFHLHNSHLQRKGRKPDIIATHGSDAVALYIQYGKLPETIATLNQTLHIKVFKENYYFRHVKVVKLVAVYAAHNKTVLVQKCDREIHHT